MKENTLWFPYAQMKTIKEPVEIEKGEGAYLYTKDGKKLIDSISSWWCAIHGYNNKELNQSLKDQIDKISHVMLGGITHKPAKDFSKRLVEISPKGLNHVFFSDSGSVAVEVALKIAIQYWVNKGYENKNQILSLKKSYHGDTFKAMEVGADMCYHKAFSKLFGKTIYLESPSSGFNSSIKSVNIDLMELEEKLKKNKDLAAFIVEPIAQLAGGFNFYNPVYLCEAKKLCEKYDVLFIFDEVATGFGRTGELFAANHSNVCPDIMVLGKGLTAGYIGHAATLTTTKIYKEFYSDDADKAFMHGPTFMGNPLACAVGLKSIEIFKRENYLEKVKKIEEFLINNLFEIKSDKIKDIRYLGAIGVIEVGDYKDLDGIQEFGIKNGVWLRPYENYIYIMPPYIIKEEELLKIINVIKEWFSKK